MKIKEPLTKDERQAQHSPDWTKQPFSFNEVIRQRDNYKANAQRLADALKRARAELGRVSGHNCWKLCDDINEVLAQWGKV